MNDHTNSEHILTLIVVVFAILVVYFTVQDIIKLISVNLYNHFNIKNINSLKEFYLKNKQLDLDHPLISDSKKEDAFGNAARTPVDMIADVKSTLRDDEVVGLMPKQPKK